MPLHSQHLELDIGAALPTPSAGKAVLGMDADGALVTKTPSGIASPVAFPKLAAHPATPTDKAIGYCLDVLGTDQFFVKTEDGTTHQITPPSVGGGGALPFVLVTVSQAAPAGFSYLVTAPGVVLTLAAGAADDRFAVTDLGGPVQIVADTVAPDSVQADGGNSGATFTTPAEVPRVRTYQFAAFATAWVQTSREPFAGEEGTLPFLTYSGTVVAGFNHFIAADPGADVVLPPPFADQRIALTKGYAGALTISTGGGPSFIKSTDGTLVMTEDASAWGENSCVEYQNRGGENIWRLISKVVF